MPIRVDDDLPVKKILEDENIFVMGSDRAIRQDIRPLDILILNLMPLKQDAELQLMRSLSNTPLQVNISLIRTMTYESKHAPKGHLERFYTDFSSIKDRKWDGFIITGAPIEKMEFEDVEYWDELKEIMDWSEKNVTSTIHICWGAQAGLYYRYGVPHSRYTGVDKDEIVKNPHLEIVAESDEAGPYLIIGDEGKNIFVTGHPEYDILTLDKEYKRDLAKGLNPDIPVNYYPDNDPSKTPIKSWRCHANTLYANWLNYYVYQITPYLWTEKKGNK